MNGITLTWLATIKTVHNCTAPKNKNNNNGVIIKFSEKFILRKSNLCINAIYLWTHERMVHKTAENIVRYVYTEKIASQAVDGELEIWKIPKVTQLNIIFEIVSSILF